MRDFCKIFRDPKLGQLLAVLKQNPDGEPCVTITFEYDDSRIEYGPSFPTENGWHDAETFFDRLDSKLASEAAHQIVVGIIDSGEEVH